MELSIIETVLLSNETFQDSSVEVALNIVVVLWGRFTTTDQEVQDLGTITVPTGVVPANTFTTWVEEASAVTVPAIV